MSEQAAVAAVQAVQAAMQEAVRAALDEVEARIREQAAAVGVGSMAWRAHMADVMHVGEVRQARAGTSTGESSTTDDERGSDA